jgi:hypothetical protein
MARYPHSDERLDRLIDTFPIIMRYAARDYKRHGKNRLLEPIQMGLGTQPGWDAIVWDALQGLEDHCRSRLTAFTGEPNTADTQARIKGTIESMPAVTQIKEKFGGLRIYLDHGDAVCRDIISRAEMKASRTCDMCGRPGRVGQHRRGWVNVRCESHQSS